MRLPPPPYLARATIRHTYLSSPRAKERTKSPDTYIYSALRMPGKANVACAEEILLKAKANEMRLDLFHATFASGSHAMRQGAGQNIIIAKTTQAGGACLLPHWFSRNPNSLNPNSLKQSWFAALLLCQTENATGCN